MSPRRRTLRKYGDVVRERMQDLQNPLGRPVTIRERSRHVGCSYEQVRKIVRNEPVMSKRASDAISSYLGLNAIEMWDLAKREQVARYFTRRLTRYLPPPDPRLEAIWDKLTPSDFKRLMIVAEGFAMANDLERESDANGKELEH